MKKLVLQLTKYETIEIISDFEIDIQEVDFCCGELQGYFINNELHVRIGQQSAGLFFEALIGKLKKVINNNLQLDKSLIENLGCMYNKYFHALTQKNSKFVMISTLDGTNKYWVGAHYKIWSTFADANPYVSTWLYNDHQGNIIFEVTPFYKWSMQKADLQDPEYVTYEQFMKDYKPLIYRVIPQEIAIKWLDQAMQVYRGFFSTEENYINMCRELGW